MHNKDVKNAAGACGIRLWQIADALGISDSAFSRKMRKELPQEEKDIIFAIIERLAKE